MKHRYTLSHERSSGLGRPFDSSQAVEKVQMLTTVMYDKDCETEREKEPRDSQHSADQIEGEEAHTRDIYEPGGPGGPASAGSPGSNGASSSSSLGSDGSGFGIKREGTADETGTPGQVKKKRKE
ncbi:hypothetical protein BGZ82_004678 [Podila clonocystis]|nr:hypothetical protein BGZ82_004678 [Podila clonocystis]